MKKSTLLYYLQNENPSVLYFSDEPTSKQNTRADASFRPKEIQPWEEFSFDALRNMSAGLLFRVLEKPLDTEPRQIEPRSESVRRVGAEPSIQNPVGQWNQVVVTEALSKAREQCYRFQNVNMQMVVGSSAKPFKGAPDWAGVRRRSSDIDAQLTNRPKIILPGDTKVNRKWASSDVPLGRVRWGSRTRSKLDPVLQVFKYCILINSRYSLSLRKRKLCCSACHQ
ncbi:hypothetical protein EV356DRAFT_339454 [Viridothelium virens]|uniref:Uncharacterized protein n=1 Tax=Viridothelium virens TaxID=1048519 RepID=A0A6A6GXL2_VIRVR|nr:hypothetical protein EV356DRAFT_339454 [Viridothelium virens]